MTKKLLQEGGVRAKQGFIMIKQKLDKQLIYLLPLIILSAVVPLIVFVKPVPLSGVVADLWGKDVDADVFSWYKSFVIILSGATIALLLLFELMNQRATISNYTRKRNPLLLWYLIPLVVYLLFTVLSTLFSEYRGLALTGFPERYEGMYVIAVYIITVFYIIHVVRNERQVKLIIVPLLISAVLVSIPGIFQYFDMDYFQSDTVRNIILAPAKDMVQKVLYDWNAVYSTLYNPNYVGSYMAMLLPVSVTFYILSKQKKHKILLGLLCCILFACQIGSRSRAGFLGISFTAVLLLILLRKRLLKNWIYIAALSVAFGLIFSGMNSYKRGALSKQYERISSEFHAVVTTPEAKTPVQDIHMDKNRIYIKTRDNPMNIAYENGELKFRDSAGGMLRADITSIGETVEIKFADEKFSDYKFEYNTKLKTLKMDKAGKQFNFALEGDEFKFVDNKGRLTEIPEVEKLDLKGREYVVKGRIYIWSRTIPLLLNSIILGQGPDTYPVHFPQNDYIGKLNGIGDMWIIIDKPHNLYLQVGTSSGIVAMLAFLLLFAVYFLHSLKLYIKNSDFDFMVSAGIAFFAAFCGYAVAALFNDSVVSVAPVFWVLLGLGISININ